MAGVRTGWDGGSSKRLGDVSSRATVLSSATSWFAEGATIGGVTAKGTIAGDWLPRSSLTLGATDDAPLGRLGFAARGPGLLGAGMATAPVVSGDTGAGVSAFVPATIRLGWADGVGRVCESVRGPEVDSPTGMANGDIEVGTVTGRAGESGVCVSAASASGTTG